MSDNNQETATNSATDSPGSVPLPLLFRLLGESVRETVGGSGLIDDNAALLRAVKMVLGGFTSKLNREGYPALVAALDAGRTRLRSVLPDDAMAAAHIGDDPDDPFHGVYLLIAHETTFLQHAAKFNRGRCGGEASGGPSAVIGSFDVDDIDSSPAVLRDAISGLGGRRGPKPPPGGVH